MTYNRALKTLPHDAKWSCSFGNPGNSGYVEHHRTPDGRRFELTWDGCGWTVKAL